MSLWTYIDGCITVSPKGRTQIEKRYILESILNHLPVVTGSERDMQVYIVQKTGYESFYDTDEYGDCTNNLVDDFGRRSQSKGYLKVQPEYIVVVSGALRDRVFYETYMEFMKWLCRLAKRTVLENILVRISDFEKEYVLNDICDCKSPFYQIYELPQLV